MCYGNSRALKIHLINVWPEFGGGFYQTARHSIFLGPVCLICWSRQLSTTELAPDFRITRHYSCKSLSFSSVRPLKEILYKVVWPRWSWRTLLHGRSRMRELEADMAVECPTWWATADHDRLVGNWFPPKFADQMKCRVKNESHFSQTHEQECLGMGVGANSKNVYHRSRTLQGVFVFLISSNCAEDCCKQGCAPCVLLRAYCELVSGPSFTVQSTCRAGSQVHARSRVQRSPFWAISQDFQLHSTRLHQVVFP